MFLIGIDPGHGGYDPGATSPEDPDKYDYLYSEEADIVLDIGLKLKSLEEEKGRGSLMTRVNDKFMSLRSRSTLLNVLKCNIAISIHINSSNNENATYVSTYIYGKGGEAEKIAKSVQDRLCEYTSWPDGGVRVANFHMLRETDMPAILVEIGFISNLEEETALDDPEFRFTIARAISDGIDDYRVGGGWWFK